MMSQVEQGRFANSCDEISTLAELYLLEPGARGLQRIDERISDAMAESRWDEMSKWHRVRFRLLRFQQQRAIAERLGAACDSP